MLVVAAPAVAVARAVVEAHLRSGRQRAQPRLRPAHPAVEEEAVEVADVDAEELAPELGTERGPIAREDVAEVVVLAPVRGDVAVDDAGRLVVDATRI